MIKAQNRSKYNTVKEEEEKIGGGGRQKTGKLRKSNKNVNDKMK